MNSMNYIGLDIHKKSISCCVRQADGTIIQESTITATRQALDEWMGRLPQPWIAGMEATLFRRSRESCEISSDCQLNPPFYYGDS